jgi:hypothetical protein
MHVYRRCLKHSWLALVLVSFGASAESVLIYVTKAPVTAST